MVDFCGDADIVLSKLIFKMCNALQFRFCLSSIRATFCIWENFQRVTWMYFEFMIEKSEGGERRLLGELQWSVWIFEVKLVNDWLGGQPWNWLTVFSHFCTVVLSIFCEHMSGNSATCPEDICSYKYWLGGAVDGWSHPRYVMWGLRQVWQ